MKSWSISISIQIENRIEKADLILQPTKGNFSKSWMKLSNKIQKQCDNDPAASKISSYELYFIDSKGNKILMTDEQDFQS